MLRRSLFSNLIAGFGLATLGLLISALPGAAEPQMRAHFFNVGKGDATILEFPCGVVMFDAGGGPDSKLALRADLDQFFATRPDLQRRIDLVILSHGHIDHVRNLDDVLDRFSVDQVISNGRRDAKGIVPLVDRLDSLGASHTTVRVGDIPTKGKMLALADKLGCYGEVPIQLRLFWGGVSGDMPLWSAKSRKDENNSSIALLVNWGETRTLLTGDMVHPALKAMMDRSGKLLKDVDLYHISHHGFPSGTLEEFDNLVRPRIAILSRPGNRAWLVDTLHRYNRIVRRERNPVVVPVWAYANEEAKLSDLGDSMSEEEIDMGTRKEGDRGRVPGWDTLTKAVYWTGMDGNIIVTVEPDGKMAVQTENGT
jgi:competence protein ComEC